MARSFGSRWMAAIVLNAFLLMPTVAQNSKGTILGRAADSAGGELQGARVMLRPGGYSTVSNGQGEFTITDLAPGDYEVTISYVGFATLTSKVTVVAGQATRLDAVLKVASANEEIVVTAERPQAKQRRSTASAPPTTSCRFCRRSDHEPA